MCVLRKEQAMGIPGNQSHIVQFRGYDSLFGRSRGEEKGRVVHNIQDHGNQVDELARIYCFVAGDRPHKQIREWHIEKQEEIAGAIQMWKIDNCSVEYQCHYDVCETKA
jgi:hypothetical protein